MFTFLNIMRYGLVSFRGPKGDETYDPYPSSNEVITSGNTYLLGRGIKKSVSARPDVFEPMPEKYKLKGTHRGKNVEYTKETYPLYPSTFGTFDFISSYEHYVRDDDNDDIVKEEDGSALSTAPSSMKIDDDIFKIDYGVIDKDREDYDMLEDVFYDAPEIPMAPPRPSLMGQPGRMIDETYDTVMKPRAPKMITMDDLASGKQKLQKTEQVKPISTNLVSKESLGNALKNLKKTPLAPELKADVTSDIQKALKSRRRDIEDAEDAEPKKLKDILNDIPAVSTRTRQGAATAKIIETVKKTLPITSGDLTDKKKQLKAIDKIQTKLEKGGSSKETLGIFNAIKLKIAAEKLIDSPMEDAEEWGDRPKTPPPKPAPLVKGKRKAVATGGVTKKSKGKEAAAPVVPRKSARLAGIPAVVPAEIPSAKKKPNIATPAAPRRSARLAGIPAIPEASSSSTPPSKAKAIVEKPPPRPKSTRIKEMALKKAAETSKKLKEDKERDARSKRDARAKKRK